MYALLYVCFFFIMYFLCFRKKSYKISFSTQFQLREDGADRAHVEKEEEEEEKHGE